jgi:hypothetical protein
MTICFAGRPHIRSLFANNGAGAMAYARGETFFLLWRSVTSHSLMSWLGESVSTPKTAFHCVEAKQNTYYIYLQLQALNFEAGAES